MWEWREDGGMEEWGELEGKRLREVGGVEGRVGVEERVGVEGRSGDGGEMGGEVGGIGRWEAEGRRGEGR